MICSKDGPIQTTHEAGFAPGLAVAGAVMLAFGAKLWLITAYGSVVPYWDQWDAEADLLYAPYMEGRFDVWQLIASHNEHRILFTRLIALGLLELAGGWDTLLQMVVNAALHALFVGLLVVLATRPLSRTDRVLAIVVSAAVLAVPVGWENTLAGFQSQFYMLLIAAVGAVRLLIGATAFSPRWWAGSGLAVLSYLCMASGALTLVPVIAVTVVQLAIGICRGRREWLGVLLHVGVVLGLLVFVRVVEAHAPLRAQSVLQFVVALSELVSWPIPAKRIGVFVVYVPLAILGARLLLERRPLGDPAWALVATGGWILVQFVSLAYGRAVGITASRYLDFAIVGVIVNLVALVLLVRDESVLLRLRFAYVAASLWLAIIATTFIGTALPRALVDAAERGRIGRAHLETVGKFLRTGDARAILQARPYFESPYPNPDRLLMLLAIPSVREQLPLELHGDAGAVAVGQSSLVSRGQFARSTRALRAALLANHAPLVGLGVALLITALMGAWDLYRREPR